VRGGQGVEVVYQYAHGLCACMDVGTDDLVPIFSSAWPQIKINRDKVLSLNRENIIVYPLGKIFEYFIV